jgi:hypothetical protein
VSYKHLQYGGINGAKSSNSSVFKWNPRVSSKEIYGGLDISLSYVTVKRALQTLVSEQFVRTTGKGKGTKYELSRLISSSRQSPLSHTSNRKSMNETFKAH